MKIEAGKYYKTRDGQKAYCTSVQLDSPKGFIEITIYSCLFVTEDKRFSTTITGKQLSALSKNTSDIVSEWIEPKQTRVFKSKKQLAKALMKGQKWRIKGGFGICFYNEVGYCSPFKYDDKDFMNRIWNLADGETIWERVE